MSLVSENETWLIDEGHVILERKAELGHEALRPIERLIRCWWVADYSMRNAGDLDSAFDLDANFLIEGSQLSTELDLPKASRMFSLDKEAFETSFFERFEDVCDELKKAYDS